MQLTMIGHSTVLIETAGKRILTDPYFGTWGNPAYLRRGKPARSREDLADIDGVLISRTHWDHVDRKYLKGIGDSPVWVPKTSRWMTKLQGGRNVTGLKVWDSCSIGEIKITAVPAVHLTFTLGFVIESEHKQIYFAGDTFYRPFMQQIGESFQLDVALMPVTTYRIPMTMGEKSAVKAVLALQPTVVIPIHLGIQPRSPLLRTTQSPEGFAQRLKESGSDVEVVILRDGEGFSV